MKKLIFSIFLVFLTLTAWSSAVQSQPECQSNCAQAELMGKQYYVVARGYDGAVVAMAAIESPDIPLTVIARLNARLASDAIAPQGCTPPCVDVTTETYETPTELIVVTTYIYFDANGNVSDVQVHTQRFKKHLK